MFRRKRRRRRSELRLGVPNIDYETQASRSRPRWFASFFDYWRTRTVQASGLAMLGLLLILIYTLFNSPQFFVYGADIQGNVTVSSREIYTISKIDSQSIFWVNPDVIVQRVVSLPNIKAATVSVALPANVVIEVIERRPELLWQTGNTLWWIDHEGFVVPPTGDITGMMRIIDDDQQPLQAGYQIDKTIVEGAQQLRILAPEVSFVRYSKARGLLVSTPEGWPVFLGNGREVRAKLVVLTAILADLKKRNIKPAYIDIRDPLRPVYQPQLVIQIPPPPPTPTPQPKPELVIPDVPPRASIPPGYQPRPSGGPAPSYPPPRPPAGARQINLAPPP